METTIVLERPIYRLDGTVAFEAGQKLPFCSIDFNKCVFPAQALGAVGEISDSIISGPYGSSPVAASFTKCIFLDSPFYLHTTPQATLSNCNFSWIQLPAPSAMLRDFFWGTLSSRTQKLAMRLDMACHERPEIFAEWATGGRCPYEASKFAQQVRFAPERCDFEKGFLSCPPPRPIDVLKAILNERCPLWDQDPLRWIDHVFHTRSPGFRNIFRRALSGFGDVYDVVKREAVNGKSSKALTRRYFAPSDNVARDFYAKDSGYVDRYHMASALLTKRLPVDSILENENETKGN